MVVPRTIAVVDDDDALAAEHLGDRVQLEAHRGLARRLIGHDEGPAGVAVLDEPLAVRHRRARSAIAWAAGREVSGTATTTSHS
jgi:hypothetical protein